MNRASVKLQVQKKRDGFGEGSKVYWSLATDGRTVVERQGDPKDDRQRAEEILTDQISTDDLGDGELRKDGRQRSESRDDRIGEDPDEQEADWPISIEEVTQDMDEEHAECRVAIEPRDANPAAPVAMALPGKGASTSAAQSPQSPVEANRPPLSRFDHLIPWEGSPSSRLNPLGTLLDQADMSRRSQVGK